jgi:fructokinase
MARIGIDLGGTKTEIIVLHDDGQIGLRRREPTPSLYQDKIALIAQMVTSVEAEMGLAGLPVGVGHPGSLNPRTGLMRNANSTALNGHPINDDLNAALNRQVRCANDANCFALSEASDGAGAGASIVFGIIIGTGVGGGLVIDGKLIPGFDGNAGEWGHTALPRPSPEEIPGPESSCGRNGCVESWCSGPAVARDHMRVTRQELTAKDISERAQTGDSDCQATLARHVDRLARALSNVVNVLDPEVIVLGGGLSNLPNMAECVQTALYPHIFTDDPQTKVVKNQHGDSSGVRGAAWLWPLER